MLDFLLDENGDICLDENGDLAMVDGAAEVAQAAAIRLRSHRGEYFLDKEFGPDWRGRVLTKPYSQASAEDHIRSELKKVNELTSVKRLRMPKPPEGNQLPADIEINTIYGPEVIP